MSALTLLPFAQVPGEILMDDRLKPTHIRVLIALYMHKNKKREEVWPKRKTLSLLTGIHEATISRLTTELEQWGWLTKQGNSGGCGRPAAYRVHVPDHLTSKFDTTVNEVGDIVLPETQAKSATVADSTTVADLTQNPSGIDYLTLAESARGKEQTKNRQEQTIVVSRAGAQKREPSRATVLPDGFVPNEAAVAMAADLGVNLADEQAAFEDHHTANGSTFKDWQAAFRTWLRNAQRFARRDAGRKPTFITGNTGETSYQRSMRERMQQAAPSVARKAPQDAAEFFRTVESSARVVDVAEVRAIGGVK